MNKLTAVLFVSMSVYLRERRPAIGNNAIRLK
jgi:hypothetical protein